MNKKPSKTKIPKHTPKQGDIVILDFNTNKTEEESKLAVVVSNNIFNNNTKMAMVCPIINKGSLYPTHYKLKEVKKVKGSVLCENIRSIDYENKNLKFIEKIGNNDLEEIMNLVSSCLEN